MATEIKVTPQKSLGFYIRAAKSLLKGAKDGKPAVKAKAPCEELKVSGFGGGINVASAVAAKLSADGIAEVVKIWTGYSDKSWGRHSTQITITLKAVAEPLSLKILQMDGTSTQIEGLKSSDQALHLICKAEGALKLFTGPTQTSRMVVEGHALSAQDDFKTLAELGIVSGAELYFLMIPALPGGGLANTFNLRRRVNLVKMRHSKNEKAPQEWRRF